MTEKKPLINLLFCATLVVAISILAYIIDPEFAKFTAICTATGLSLAWICSPQHDVLKGIRSISIFEWPLIAFVVVPCILFDIPILLKPFIVLCIFFIGIGVFLASRKIFKW